MNLDVCAGMLVIATILVLYVVWLCAEDVGVDVSELMDENEQLRDAIATAESRESMSKMRAASRGGKVPR